MRRIIGTSAVKNGFQGNRFFISPIFVLVVGTLIASITVAVNYIKEDSVLCNILSVYIQNQVNQNMASAFIDSFLSEIVYLTALYIFGLCIIGTPLLYIILFVYSVGKASYLSFLYLEYGFLCFAKSVFMLIPQIVLFIMVIYSAFNLSKKTSMLLFRKNHINNNTLQIQEFRFKSYNKTYLIYLVLSFIISVYDALISRLFSFLINK